MIGDGHQRAWIGRGRLDVAAEESGKREVVQTAAAVDGHVAHARLHVGTDEPRHGLNRALEYLLDAGSSLASQSEPGYRYALFVQPSGLGTVPESMPIVRDPHGAVLMEPWDEVWLVQRASTEFGDILRYDDLTRIDVTEGASDEREVLVEQKRPAGQPARAKLFSQDAAPFTRSTGSS